MKKELNVSLLQMQSRATHTPNIEKVREAAFNAKGQDSGPSSKKTVEKAGETKEEVKKK